MSSDSDSSAMAAGGAATLDEAHGYTFITLVSQHITNLQMHVLKDLYLAVSEDPSEQ